MYYNKYIQHNLLWQLKIIPLSARVSPWNFIGMSNAVRLKKHCPEAANPRKISPNVSDNISPMES